MNLKNPITITPPSIKKTDGTIKTFNPITLTELDITIIDNVKNKSVVVRIKPCPRPLVLWKDKDYDDAGDYTQLMVENKIKELLGNDPKVVLQGLFGTPPLPPQGN